MEESTNWSIPAITFGKGHPLSSWILLMKASAMCKGNGCTINTLCKHIRTSAAKTLQEVCVINRRKDQTLITQLMVFQAAHSLNISQTTRHCTPTKRSERHSTGITHN